MKRLLAILFALLIGFLGGAGTLFFYPQVADPVAAAILPDYSSAQIFPFEPRPQAPSVAFKDEADADVTLSDSSGQVRVVNFWATWCAPCIAEMPSLDRLADEMAGKRVRVMTVSVDEEGAEVVAPFLKERGWQNLTAYTDARVRLHRAFFNSSIPISFILDKRNRVAGVVQGAADWEAADIKQFLEDLLAEAG